MHNGKKFEDLKQSLLFDLLTLQPDVKGTACEHATEKDFGHSRETVPLKVITGSNPDTRGSLLILDIKNRYYISHATITSNLTRIIIIIGLRQALINLVTLSHLIDILDLV